MRVYLVCLLAAAVAVSAADAQSRQPTTKGKDSKGKAVKTSGDDKAGKSSDEPEKTGPDTVGGKKLADWVEDLTYGDPSRRAVAIMAIPAFGDEAARAVKAILSRLSDPDVSPRAKACYVLRVMAVDAKDVPAVVKALGKRLHRETESQAVVRYEAAVTLRRFAEDAKPIIPDLKKGMLDGESWEIRHACVAVLWRAALDTKEGPAKDVVDAMCARLGVTDFRAPTYEERLELIIGLGSMGRPKDPEALARVVKTLNAFATANPNNLSRSLVLWAYAGLVGMVDDPKLVASHLDGIFRFTNASKYPMVELRVQAMAALSAFGTRSKKYVPDLIKMLDDKEPMIVNAAATALTRIGEDDVDKLIDAFLSMLRQHGVSAKGTPEQQKALSTAKAGTAVIALVNLKANTKDVHDVLEKVRKDEYADRGLRHLIDQAQKQLRNPPKEKEKDKDKK